MLRTMAYTRELTTLQRIAAIALFTALIAATAQIRVYLGPVPHTLQVFAVLLAGMVLGRRDGAASVLAYIGLIVLNLPVAAGGVGIAALTGTTAGYIVGFLPAAWVVGAMVENGANRVWQRWLASLVGIAIIYAFGLPVLKLVANLDWSAAWAAGVVPFLAFDLVKAVAAAGFAEGGRQLLLRFAPFSAER